MATQVITSNSSGATPTTAINSTKIKVEATSPAGIAANIFYAIGGTSSLASSAVNFSNCEMLSTGQVRFINMKGLGNSIAFQNYLNASNILITVTECGTVYQSAMNQNVLKGVFTMTTSNATIVGSTTGLGIIAGMYVTGGNIRGNPTVTTVNSGNIVLSTASGIGSNITATLTFSVTAIQTA